MPHTHIRLLTATAALTPEHALTLPCCVQNMCVCTRHHHQPPPTLQGYSVGAWTALLAAHGFDVTTVHVLSWKKDLGLLKRDKDSSRQLAKALFQQAGVPQDELLR
jgi:hypothetical protein